MPPLHPRDPRRGRAGRPYRRLWAVVVRPGSVCWLCEEPIQWGLRRSHPMGPSLDHVIPLDLGGDPVSRSNARPAHHGCNARRGAALAAAVVRLGRDAVRSELLVDPRWMPAGSAVKAAGHDHHSEDW